MNSVSSPSRLVRPSSKRAARSVVASLWAILVALITLTPSQGFTGGVMSGALCLFCGSRGLADAILNVVLFIPLGILATHRRGTGHAVAIGLLCSARSSCRNS